jgi:hypothetical protein
MQRERLTKAFMPLPIGGKEIFPKKLLVNEK